MTKVPHLVDIKVGEKIKAHRLRFGLTQVELGDALGVTFQQIQKYEKGTNRISASRLARAAKALGMPISNFFPNQTTETGHAREEIIGEIIGFIGNEGRDLNIAFTSITAPAVRKAIIGLVTAIAEQAERSE